jgi:TPR repeat protein
MLGKGAGPVNANARSNAAPIPCTFSCQPQAFKYNDFTMKNPLQLIGSICLYSVLLTGCGGGDSSDVENSPSMAENLQQTEQDARKGDPIQMFGLGMTYYNGAEDVKKDDLLALIWLTLAAEDENLKTDPGLMQALAELNRSVSDANKANAKTQIKNIKDGFPKK